MDIYKEASKIGLKVQTAQGVLTVDQLWQCSQSSLIGAIKNLKKGLSKNNDDDLSFLEETNTIDVENQLRFDICKDIYLTKKKDNADALAVKEKKAFQQKIIEIIAEKEEGALASKSIAELKAMLDA